MNNSVVRGFEILSLFSKERPEISTAMVVQHLGLNQATVHRFLMTLDAVGAVRATRRGYFALGPKIDDLGRISEETGAISILVKPELDALARSLNESVMLCRLARTGPTCVAVANSAQAISVNITLGTVLPFVTSAQGKLWLAEMVPDERRSYLDAATIAGHTSIAVDFDQLDRQLGKIARTGYATNLGENEPDIAAVSVPVRGPDGRMVLSLSAFGLLRRFDARMIETTQSRLIDGAKRIGALLPGRPA